MRRSIASQFKASRLGRDFEQTDAILAGPDVSKRELIGLFQGIQTCLRCRPGEPGDCAKPPGGETITLHQVGEWVRKIGQAAKLEEHLDGESPAEDLDPSKTGADG
jgi:hypothetical protein